MSRRPGRLAAVLLVTVLAGCVSPIALEPALLSYDRTVSRILSQMLLINIGRSHEGLPLHWTEVSSIAATFEFRVSSGVDAAFTPMGEVPVGDVRASVSSTAAENPTISIIPVHGEEFTKRILAPIDESIFGFVAQQGTDIALLVRLMGQGLYEEETKGAERKFFANDPQRGAEYDEFRRRTTHLSALQRLGALSVSRLRLREEWPVRAETLTGRDIARAHEQGFRLEKKEDGTLVAWHVLDGRLVITNYDPRHLNEGDRRELDRRAKAYPPNFVFVDVKPGHPGGDYPLSGWIKLRSFAATLEFVGRGMDEGYERPVAKDPRTPAVDHDPVRTLEVVRSKRPPEDAVLTGELRDHSLSIVRSPDARATRWNLKGFEVLLQLYHITTRNVPRLPGPIISIAK